MNSNLNIEEMIKSISGDIGLKAYQDSKKLLKKLDDLQYQKSNKKSLLKILIPGIIEEIYPHHNLDCKEWIIKTSKKYLINKMTRIDVIEVLRKIKCDCR